MAEPEEKMRQLGKWLLAALFGAIVPMLTFFSLLTWSWNFAAEPAWSWITVPVLPIASLTLLFLPDRGISKGVRFACAMFALHAVAMTVMLALEIWPSIAGASLSIDLMLLAAVLWPSVTAKPLGRLAKMTIVWIGTLFGACFLLALANGMVVAWRADAIAGYRPYCIQYASQTDLFAYEPARTLFDLSALKMQVRLIGGGAHAQYRFQHHAILIVDDGVYRFLNWSYWKEDFLDEVVDRKLFRDASPGYKPRVACKLESHYATRLSVWSRDPRNFEISIANHRFSIPEEYRPRGDGPALTINAVPPDFAPYDRQKSHLPAQFFSDILVRDEVSVNMAERLKKRMTSFPEARTVPSEFDLNKIELYVNGIGANPTRRHLVTIYTAYDSAGQLTKMIDCGPVDMDPRTPRCRFMFATDGLIFNLSIKDPSQWLAIERSLVNLFTSWRH